MAKEKEKPLTHGDVLRLIKENGGRSVGLDLSGKQFERGIDLTHLNLSGIILKEAILTDAHFEGSNLLGANLEGAELSFAHFEGAELYFTRLNGATLWSTKFSPDTKLEDVDWGNYILGEEKNNLFNQAVAPYRQLKVWYTNAGIADIAAKFYYREKEANRKALKWYSKNWCHRLALEASYRFFGYGERWRNILLWIAVVVFGFAAAYYLWGSFSSSSFSDTLYYSAASFTALGYGRWAPQPLGWAKVMGAAEAFIGVSMMALLLVTFVRKWTR